MRTAGEKFVGLVSGATLFNEVLTDRLVSTVARRDSGACLHVVGTLLSWPDFRSRVTDVSHYVAVVTGSQCLRPRATYTGNVIQVT